MSRQPLFIVCICLILGIVSQETFGLNNATVFLLLVAVIVGVALSFVKNLFYQKFRNVFLCFLFYTIGIFSHCLNTHSPILPDFKKNEEVAFKLNKKLNSSLKNRRYEISVLQTTNKNLGFKAAVNAVLSVPKTQRPLDFTQYYRGEVYVSQPASLENNFGFDYKEYLKRQRIYFQMYMPGTFVSVKKSRLSVSEKIKQKRLEILQRIDSAQLSTKTREFTKGIILADRTDMDQQTVQDFSKSGLVHILAISGSHMAVIFWLILFLLKPVFPPALRNIPIIVSIVLIWVFAVFIDYGSSVVRSCIMISVYYIYVLLQRKPDLLHAAALSALIILAVDTEQFYDVGFQLSYVAVLGIYWLNKPILDLLPKFKTKIGIFLANVLSVSASAQLSTLPLVVYYFHQFSLVSFVANLVVIPFSEIMIVFSLLMTVLIGIFGQVSFLGSFYDISVSALLKAVHFFGSMDGALVKNIPVNMYEVFLIFTLVYLLRRNLMNFNFKYLLQFAAVVLLYFGLRMFFNLKEYLKEETLVHHFYKNSLLSVKHKNRVVFWLPEGIDREKVGKTLIDPYVTARRADSVEIRVLPKGAVEAVVDNKTYNLK